MIITYSDKLPPFVMEWEICRLKAYWDGSKREDGSYIWTCGYGHTRGVHSDTTCNATVAGRWLKEDLDEAAAGVVRNVGDVLLEQCQFDALVDFVFCFGEGRLRTSTLLKLVRYGSHERAANEFPKWNRFLGKVSHGLLARRAGETLMYAFGDYTGV